MVVDGKKWFAGATTYQDHGDGIRLQRAATWCVCRQAMLLPGGMSSVRLGSQLCLQCCSLVVAVDDVVERGWWNGVRHDHRPRDERVKVLLI